MSVQLIWWGRFGKEVAHFKIVFLKIVKDTNMISNEWLVDQIRGKPFFPFVAYWLLTLESRASYSVVIPKPMFTIRCCPNPRRRQLLGFFFGLVTGSSMEQGEILHSRFLSPPGIPTCRWEHANPISLSHGGKSVNQPDSLQPPPPLNPGKTTEADSHFLFSCSGYTGIGCPLLASK